MKYALTAAMAKKVDEITMKETGLPSMVLMERAALSVAEKTAEIAAIFQRPVKIAAVCGSGNNGADGVAVARILSWQGLPCDFIPVGNEEHATQEYRDQVHIALASGMKPVEASHLPEYDILIDAIFGVGLSREISGNYCEIIRQMNQEGHINIAVDVPSGIDATTGMVLGIAVKAQATVTFGYHRQGLLLTPGREYAGEVTVADIGFYPEAIRLLNPAMYFTTADLEKIPKRDRNANKGTYGRTLVIAGSHDMSGAAFLSGVAAYRSGCGLVEIFTDECNSAIIKKLLPEAIVTGYTEQNAVTLLEERIPKAAAIILGPGLSKDDPAPDLVRKVLDEGQCPLIMDADALNIVATMPSCRYQGTLIVTPHIGEMIRLCGWSKEEILRNPIAAAKEYAVSHHAITVLKNSVTVIAEPDEEGRVYINTSGSPAMAKGGSGDVLTGIIAGMLALRIEPFSAAAMGVYVHGLCGEAVAAEKGEHSLLASDMTEQIGKIMS